MGSEPRSGDWELLGVEPGATEGDIHAAYRRRRQLWDGSDPATYALLLQEEQAELLDRLEAAYHRVLGDAERRASPRPRRLSSPPGGEDDGVLGPTPARAPEDIPPNRYLRLRREDLGMTLHDVSAETKIRPVVLEDLEGEDTHALPARVYVRGFVVQICRCLRIEDPESFARRYLDQMDDASSET